MTTRRSGPGTAALSLLVGLPMIVGVVALWGLSLGWWDAAQLLDPGPGLPAWLWVCGVIGSLALARRLLVRGRRG